MAMRRRTSRHVRAGRYGDLKGSQAQWTLTSPQGSVEIKVKLVDRFRWRGLKFAVVVLAR